MNLTLCVYLVTFRRLRLLSSHSQGKIEKGYDITLIGQEGSGSKIDPRPGSKDSICMPQRLFQWSTISICGLVLISEQHTVEEVILTFPCGELPPAKEDPVSLHEIYSQSYLSLQE